MALPGDKPSGDPKSVCERTQKTNPLGYPQFPITEGRDAVPTLPKDATQSRPYPMQPAKPVHNAITHPQSPIPYPLLWANHLTSPAFPFLLPPCPAKVSFS